MKCGIRGGGYSKISSNLFGWSTARNMGTCDNRLNIRRDVLEASVLNGLKQHLMDPDLFKEFADEFYREINRYRMEKAAQIERAKTELGSVERKIRRIVDAVSEGLASTALKDELLRLERRREELRAVGENASAPEPPVHPNLTELYRRKVASTGNAISVRTFFSVFIWKWV